ncbi:MAG TPA: ABC transporter substrate-binding protein [Xanthobacteraceae bacterium]|jgi:NitT/TauT family transport system substrate-binding protein|nr:ABC transporter substrate-binding protein [Xanthobacteraceae bacterium]
MMRIPPSIGVLAALVFALAGTPAAAQQTVKIGTGFGLAFLPLYLMDELQLVEKHAKEAGLDVKASYVRVSGSGPMQDAILSGAVDMGPYGVPQLLLAWEKARGTPQQMFAVSGVATLPATLVTNDPNIRSLRDVRPTDRIAMPALLSPQMYMLQMAAEKTFGRGQHHRFRSQAVAKTNPESLKAVLSRTSDVTLYFSTPPYSQAALKNPGVHVVLTSSDVFAGKSSLIVLSVTKRYIDAHPKMPDVIVRAIDEAAAVIRDDPGRAAAIYLKHEPLAGFDVAAIEAILRRDKDEFGSSVHGIQAYADVMSRLGQLKSPPRSWKQVVTPPIANLPGS